VRVGYIDASTAAARSAFSRSYQAPTPSQVVPERTKLLIGRFTARTLVDRSETPPLEELAQLEDAADRRQPGAVTRLGHDAPVLVLDDALVLGELTQNHCDGLRDV
jgi:hypothetical protein